MLVTTPTRGTGMGQKKSCKHIVFRIKKCGERGISFADPIWGDRQTKNLIRSAPTFCAFCLCESKLPSAIKHKTQAIAWVFALRRMRDSNPRRCDPQRFSRPPHSTTLPILRCKNTTTFFTDPNFILNNLELKESDEY